MDNHHLLAEAESLAEYMSFCRREVHKFAECGFKLPKTLAFVAGELAAMGIKARRCGKAGLTATIGTGEGGCFLLRADMDALPVAEQSGESFAAQNGCSHACGHDMHTAMLLGAAKMLKRREGELRRPVKLMFQSAEETLEGAKDMLDSGVLRSPKVEGAMMLHVMTASPVSVGSLVLPSDGVSAPAADYFEITVRGAGCHGSSPNTGVDPISAAAHIVVALQELSARELGMGEAAVLTIGSIHGGEAGNVIPDSVTMGGSLRAMEDESREFVKRRLAEIAQSVAGAFRATAQLRFTSGCPGLRNDAGLLSFVRSCAAEVLGEEKILSAADFSASGGRGGRTAGSEDFAYISRELPAVMLALAAGEPEKGFTKPLHHPAVRFDEAAMPHGAAVLVQCAMKWGSAPLP